MINRLLESLLVRDLMGKDRIMETLAILSSAFILSLMLGVLVFAYRASP